MNMIAYELAKLIPRLSVDNAVAASTVEGATWEDIIAAALAAWPGVDYRPGAKVTKTWRDPGKIILPLPQEVSDD